MSDPLAQYRRRPAGTGSQSTGQAGPEGYLAFGAKDKVQRLQIRRAGDMARAPGYAHLWDITYDAAFGSSFTLIYTFMFVLVRGKNLQRVVTAIELGTADFIQEFDPERWPAPSDPNAPVIEHIEVAMAGGAATLSDVEKQFAGNTPGKTH
jgi:hypothetical protein